MLIQSLGRARRVVDTPAIRRSQTDASVLPSCSIVHNPLPDFTSEPASTGQAPSGSAHAVDRPGARAARSSNSAGEPGSDRPADVVLQVVADAQAPAPAASPRLCTGRLKK